MKKAIIFDFNRTLFDPEKGCLIEGAKKLLTEALFKEYTLFLLTRCEATGLETVNSSGIANLFSKIVVSEKRNICDLKKLLVSEKIDISKSIVIGDSIKAEIRLGNTLGLTTIWFRNGKFSNTLPTRKIEKPKVTVKKLAEVKKFLQ